MFHWVEARAYCHATEDEEKVLAALRVVLPVEGVRREVLEGHFGNPLIAFTGRIEKAGDVEGFWRRALADLGREVIVGDLEDRVDDGGVYHLRLDKQRAFQGSIARAASPDVIDVRAKIAAFPNKREVALRVARGFLEGL